MGGARPTLGPNATSEVVVKAPPVPTLAASSLAAFSLVLAAGCIAKSSAVQTTELAAYGDDDLQTETNVEAFAQGVVAGSGTVVAVNPADGFFQPSGCLVADVTASQSSATFTFTDCTGPFGLVHLTGIVDATWTGGGSSPLDVTFNSTNFKVNSATVTSWTAKATVTPSGNDRTMVWSATLAGTTGAGRAFARTNHKTLTWTVGGTCLTIAGQSTGTVTGLDLQTTLVNYQLCDGACPVSGSEVTVEDVTTGANIDLKYLTGGEAQFTAVDGKVTDFPVVCGL
jgi:hypothetical protein